MLPSLKLGNEVRLLSPDTLRFFPPRPAQSEKKRQNCQHGNGTDLEHVVNTLRFPGPALLEEITERDERAAPNEPAGVGKESELVESHLHGARDEGRQVPDARQEITGHQSPPARVIEPVVSRCDPGLGDMEVTAELMDEIQAERPAQQIVDRHAEDAPEKRGGDRGRRREFALEQEVPEIGKQPLVRYRKTEDAERKQD